MKALILVDIQNDFIPGGALAVPGGDQIIPTVNRLQRLFDVVVATRDWHPPDHGSFAANHPGKKPGDVIQLDGLSQVLWPVHCVQNTVGAALAPSLDTPLIAEIIDKGTDPGIDSYSGFFDNGHRKATGLGDFLAKRRVREVYVAGLATDYCVKFTALDAVRLGYKTHVIEDACRGVDLKPGDVTRALEELKLAGVTVMRSA
jgi:nicotinamidase/pyrazinamidase